MLAGGGLALAAGRSRLYQHPSAFRYFFELPVSASRGRARPKENPKKTILGRLVRFR